MKEKLSAAGAVLAAGLASSCCWGPLLLAALGAGGAGFASVLAPYRPYFAGLTFAFLAGAWWFVLRLRPARLPATTASSASADTCCAPGGDAPRLRRRNILLLSGVTAFAAVMLFFPQLYAVLAQNRNPAPIPPGRSVEELVVGIKGMTCEACAVEIRNTLLKVPGVVSAEVDYRTSTAHVSVERGKVAIDDLRASIEKSGYAVTSVSPAAAAEADTPAASRVTSGQQKTALLGIEGMTRPVG